ncbi:MAG: hypothetical protein AAF557_08985 [Pseudomonadota bacterium]
MSFCRFFALAMLVATTTGASNVKAEDWRFSEFDNINQAILAARSTLDLFWQVASLEPCGCSGVVLAIKLPWEGKVVDVDIVDVRRLGPGHAEGKVRYADVMEVPELADVVVQFTDDDIVDWGFGRDGQWYGLFQFQAIQAGAKVIPAAEMEAAQRDKFKAITLP